ncbi:DUF4262 domain-containing protein [Mycolicibacterium vinylchloridicum]|jgi:hypothetical protein|uniref:DUF4262 domain-containing protein n=1 Tax=Mycolicibacterium vinylchloridicum TaxID=2736928 RepID=UPI001F41FFB8|nr:DUF4262 domain-containing protein [Mycolicibacterium vinylchloridicum]
MVSVRNERGHAMCWICDHPDRTIADYLDEVRGKIQRRGWTVQYVESPQLPFAYTIGLTDYGVPELLITNVSPQRALRVLNGSAEHLLRGVQLTAGQQFTLCGCPMLEVVEVEHPDAHMGFAVALYGPIRALQLVWADGRGRWPWAADFCDRESRQPVLGVRARAA